MTTKQFLDYIEKTFQHCHTILIDKNADYAEENSPFKNFKISETVGVPVERAILVRMTDKMSRISNLLDKEESVKGESINDSLDDLINYAGILKAYINQ